MPPILTKEYDRKDSFDRIDDDLCEVLLSYLSLDSKFRFECVSKQFQRCVYQRQHHLIIDFRFSKKLKRTDLLGNKLIDLDLFESILSKCPNISQVLIETIANHSESNYQQMVEHIITYCKYLSSIDLYFTETNEEIFRKLFTKFGSQLKKIGFIGDSGLHESHLILCKNLKEININRLKPNHLKQLFFEENEISLKRLKKIHMKCSSKESEGFGWFVKKCQNSLEIIDLHIHGFDDNTVYNVLKGIKEFKSLKTLKIYFDYDVIIDYSMATQFIQIAINCPKLKCLVLKLRTRQLSQSLEIFNVVKHFKQLKKFELRFSYLNSLLKNKSENHFTCQSLKECLNLTHFTLHGSRVFDAFFDNMSTHLPKLEYLNVSNALMSETSFKEVSKLNNLRSLCLHLYHINSFGHIIKVIENCLKLHLVDLLTYGLHVVLDEVEIDEIREEPHMLAHFLKIDLK